jgi:hypothetical protein
MPLLAVFGIAELCIGRFGICSLPIFHFVAQYVAGSSALGRDAIPFVLLLVPTALMGSTLPILTEHLVRIRQRGPRQSRDRKGSGCPPHARLQFVGLEHTHGLAATPSGVESYTWSPSHDQRGMLRPFGTSSPDWW